MYTRILNHLSEYNILSTEQYGFRIGLMTVDAIYKLTAKILNAMNNKLLVGGILCDLEKVFDCVDHGIQLSKLNVYGVNGKDFALYQSYLDKRYCRTAVYNDSSNSYNASCWTKVRHGIPQGSVLRPTLFLLYTGCPRRNGQNFGRVFLMLTCTDIIQNTYIQSSTVTEIMAREV
jgi:hypothetical protein